MGRQWKQCQTLFLGAPKSLQMVIAAMKLLTPWKESYDQPREHIKKQRHYFANKGPFSQGSGFSSGHVSRNLEEGTHGTEFQTLRKIHCSTGIVTVSL